MDEPFTLDKTDFVAYSVYHTAPIITVLALGLLLIVRARALSSRSQQWHWLFLLSLVPALSVLVQMGLHIIEGDFDAQTDLPFHICRFAALLCPLAIMQRNHFWMGIFYFWILAGTLNANITPDIEFNYPHWDYFAYWTLHSVLVVIPLYYVLVLQVRIRWRDAVNAFLMTNAFLLLTLALNFSIGSNYMYSRHKPPVNSLLDYLGPWPVYLFTGEVLMIILFLLLYAPFAFARNGSGDQLTR